jgi:hypothetical protein
MFFASNWCSIRRRVPGRCTRALAGDRQPSLGEKENQGQRWLARLAKSRQGGLQWPHRSLMHRCELEGALNEAQSAADALWLGSDGMAAP